MTDEVRRLLLAAVQALGEAERRELRRAALEDQALFDRLVEQNGLLEGIQDPDARQELLSVVEETTPWGRLRAWFERPATLLDLGGVTTVVLAALAGYAWVALPPASSGVGPTTSRPVGATLSPQLVVALLALPERQGVPAGIEVAGRPDADFAPGETMRLRVTLRAPARAVVLEEPAGQAWPSLGLPPALVPRPPGGGPAIQEISVEAVAAEGTHRLRLVVAPADLDIGVVSVTVLPGLADRLTLVDLPYRVVRRR